MRFLRFIPIGIVAVMAMSRAVNYRSVESPEPFTPPKQHTFPIYPDTLFNPFMFESFNLDSLPYRFNTIGERPQAHIMQPPVYNYQGPRINLDSLPGSISIKDRNHLISIFDSIAKSEAYKSEVSFGLPEKPQVGFGNSDDYTFPKRDFDLFPNRFPITQGGSSNDDIAIPESSDDSEDNDSTPPVLEPETVPDDKEETTSETPTEETITPTEETTTPAEEVIDTNNQP